MNERKQHVIETAHKLFVEKGFQATSIQDILESSGISKGTFYNYFTSKNELLIALFVMIYERLDKERNELLIGQDPADIEIFIKQVELQLNTNRKYKLISLFEEAFFSNDPELKTFIREGQIRLIRWVYKRFLDIFGESKKPYLLDCANMFTGMLSHNVKYYVFAHGSNSSLDPVVRYTVERVTKLVKEVSDAEQQLVKPELLDSWLSVKDRPNEDRKAELLMLISTLKSRLRGSDEQARYVELLDFLQDELLDMKKPRRFLIESTLRALLDSERIVGQKELQELTTVVEAYMNPSGSY